LCLNKERQEVYTGENNFLKLVSVVREKNKNKLKIVRDNLPENRVVA
jgi:hypothetical protein